MDKKVQQLFKLCLQNVTQYLEHLEAGFENLKDVLRSITIFKWMNEPKIVKLCCHYQDIEE